MANRTTSPMAGYYQQMKTVSLRFFPQGTGAPVVNNKESAGVASVTRTGVGTFLVTLDTNYRNLVGFNASVQSSSAADLRAQVGDVSNLGTSSATTVVVRLLAGATPTDQAANANNSVSLQLSFDDSSSRE